MLPDPPGPWRRLDWILLAAVIATALAVRLGYFFAVHDLMWFKQPLVDAANYHR